MPKNRKRKYGVWLHNNTDSADDEWEYVTARSSAEAKKLVEYNECRFRLGQALPIKKFRKEYNIYGM